MQLLARFSEHYSLAQIYSAYHLVHAAAANGSCSAALPASLFHASHFLFTRLLQRGADQPPPGVSTAAVLQSLARHSGGLGAHGLAAAAWAQLQNCALTPSVQVHACLSIQEESIADMSLTSHSILITIANVPGGGGCGHSPSAQTGAAG